MNFKMQRLQGHGLIIWQGWTGGGDVYPLHISRWEVKEVPAGDIGLAKGVTVWTVISCTRGLVAASLGLDTLPLGLKYRHQQACSGACLQGRGREGFWRCRCCPSIDLVCSFQISPLHQHSPSCRDFTPVTRL